MVELFGQQVIANGGISLVEPDFPLEKSDILSYFQTFSTSQDINYISGFLTVINSSIKNIWETLSQEDINSIKACLITSLASDTFSSYSFQLATLVASVYHLADNIWDELLSYIFNGNNKNDTISLTLSLIIPYFTSEYVESNRDNLVNTVTSFLPEASHFVKLRLLRIYAYLTPFEFSDAFLDTYWTACYDIIHQNSRDLLILWPLLNNLFGSIGDIQKLHKPSFESDDHFMAAIHLIPCFNADLLIQILQRAGNGLKAEVFDAMSEVYADEMSDDQIEAVVKYVKSNETPENVFASLFLLVSAFSEEKPFESYKFTFMNEFCRGSPKEQEVWLYAVIALSESIGQYSKTLPKFLLASLLNIMKTDLFDLALRALKTLLKLGAINDRNQFKLIFSAIPNFEPERQRQVMKTLEILLSSDMFDPYLLSPFVMFCRNTIKVDNIIIQAQTISLLSAMCEVDENIPNQFAIEAIPILTKIFVTNDLQFYPQASSALLMFVTAQSKDISGILKSGFDQLLEYAMDKSHHYKSRGTVAEALAGIVECLSLDQYIDQMIELVDQFLCSGINSLTISAMTIIAIMQKLFNEESKLFTALVKAAIKQEKNDIFDLVLRPIEKYLRSNPILAKNFSFAVLNEFTALFAKQPLADWYSPSTTLFRIISSIKSQRDIPFLLRLSLNCRAEMFSLIFASISDIDSPAICRICEQRALSSQSVEAMKYLIKHNALNDQLLEKLIDCWKDSEDVDGDWKSLLADVILKAFADGKAISTELIEDILDYFPFNEDCESIALSIIKIIKDHIGFEQLAFPILQAFSDLLIQPAKDQNKYDISKETILAMKETIRAIVKENPQLDREMSKHYGNVRSKLNKYNSLFK